MLSSAILLDTPDQGQDILDSIMPAAESAGVALRLCAGNDEGIEILTKSIAAGDEPSAILIGPNLQHPLTAARKAHELAPLVQIIFLVDAERESELQRDLSLAPMIGNDWSIASLDVDELTQRLGNAASSTAQRRQLRTTLDHINLQISSWPADNGLAYRKLVISDRYLAAILAHAPVAIVSTDPYGTITTWNLGAEQLFQLPEYEAIGRRIEDIAAGQWAEALQSLMQDVQSNQRFSSREAACRRANGATFNVDLVVAPVREEKGGLMGISVIAHDITDRKRLDELRQAELDFAYAAGREQIDRDRNKSIVVRETGGESKGMESFDDAMDLWARQARNIVGAHQCAVSYIPHGNFAEGKHAISMSDKYEKYKTYDVLPTGDGIWRLVATRKISFCMTDEELKLHPGWKNFSDMLDDRGLEHPPMRGWLVVPILRLGVKFVGVLQLTDKYEGDFTQDDLQVLRRLAQLMAPAFSLQYAHEEVQRHGEELAKAKDALEQSNLELERFAYIASHDLQEPLRAVGGFCELLGKRYHGQLDEKANEWIEFAVDGAHRMQEMVEGLLTYSRMQSRSKPFEQVDCTMVLRRAMDNLHSSIEDTGATVTQDQIPTVTGDASQLEQLFQNLISNAIKYHGSDAPKIHLTARREGNDWLFAVSDNGIGIPAENKDKVFEIFRRLHHQDEYPGTGLGLAICKGIVQRHRGRIWVESEPGEGSTFCFTLPLGMNEAGRE
jgi:PAS domain S-box-containing protein